MTAPERSGKPTSALDKSERDIGFCPFLGFDDDPETAVAYPSPYNHCYHCKPVAPVNLVHQRKICLTREYKNCPVFQKETLEPLPKGIRAARPIKINQKFWISLAVLIVVILAGLVILSFLGILKIPGLALALPEQKPTPTQAEPTAHATAPLPSPTIEVLETSMPTETSEAGFATPFIPHAIETPFGNDPKLVIHRVQEGEGYILLAEKFGTTVDAIKAINYDLPESLWVNTVLVIPVNTDDVSGLPQFSVREITAEGMTIEDYAQRMRLDAALLKQYNSLPDGYQLEMGELILIAN